MQTVLPSEFKRLMVAMLEGTPYVVALFIARGELIRVDTAAKEYAGREAQA